MRLRGAKHKELRPRVKPVSLAARLADGARGQHFIESWQGASGQLSNGIFHVQKSQAAFRQSNPKYALRLLSIFSCKFPPKIVSPCLAYFSGHLLQGVVMVLVRS